MDKEGKRKQKKGEKRHNQGTIKEEDEEEQHKFEKNWVGIRV